MNRPRIAIIGSGPVGLETALAAREREWPFTVYERGAEPAAGVRAWSHIRLFSPWSLNASARMRGALEAAGRSVPDGEECPTGRELVDRVLDPVARLDGLAERIRTGTRVVRVSREGMLKDDAIGDDARAERPFRLLVEGPDDAEWIERADVVLDCSGTYTNPNSTGDGGIPAPGERALEDEIVRHIPDVAGDPGAWAGRTTLLVGAGHSAQTAVRDLAELAADAPGTRILWSVRSTDPEFSGIPDDPLPERSRLTRRAGELARGGSGAVELLPGTVVERMTPGGGRHRVTLRRDGGGTEEHEVDRILSLTGYVGEHRLYRQLQVHECYATSGPMSLAASLLSSSSPDCLDQETAGIDTLRNPEPRFFLLGMKSYGRNSAFLMRTGWEQVDEVFEALEG